MSGDRASLPASARALPEGWIAEADSIFQQPWWLEAAAPGAWGAATIAREGRIVARLPFRIARRRGLRLLDLPPFTPALGPWVAHASPKYAARLAEENELIGALVEALPPHDLFRLRMPPGLTNWLPFHWRGFRAETFYTYRIEDLSDPAAILAGMSQHRRRAIRQAEKSLSVRDDLGIDAFAAIYRRTFARQGRTPKGAAEALARLDAAVAAHGERRILFATDTAGAVQAAAYLLFDRPAGIGYYLLGGSDDRVREGGAASLVLWRAIEASAAAGMRIFDFEGSMVPGIEEFFRRFGARQTPYFMLRHLNSRRARLAAAAIDLLKALGLPGTGRLRSLT
ncbi:MAG: GNAT family N-acetyltransferase [Alphaproteobacteria bacterium]|nr:GNAT family N-acetyltransferase [Alphaproteobacteria bacterium]